MLWNKFGVGVSKVSRTEYPPRLAAVGCISRILFEIRLISKSQKETRGGIVRIEAERYHPSHPLFQRTSGLVRILKIGINLISLNSNYFFAKKY